MVALVAKAAAHAGEQVRFQIARDRFASVEQGDGGILVFRDIGEGYDHTSFAIESHTSLAAWQGRMQQWSAGTAERGPDRNDDDNGGAAELPEARVVDRRRQAGTTIENVVSPSALATSTRPPWSTAMSRTNARPRPVPFSRVV